MTSRLKRLVKFTVQRGLQPVEARLLRAATSGEHAPIFIVGPPRSGSTLLYQLIVRRYRLCYFSNLMMKLPSVPLAIAKLAVSWGGWAPPEDYSSRYGSTSGWSAPSQGLQFWTEWIPQFPHNLDADAVSSSVKERFRDTVLAMQGIAGAPFINKWPPNSLRVRLLAEIFPDALFLKITRALEPMVQSILRSRHDICQRGSGWFSVKPSGYADIMRNHEPAEQARWQVRSIERAIDRDSIIIGARKFMLVRYEELASRPREVLKEVGQFYGRNTGGVLEVRGEVPPSFERTGGGAPVADVQVARPAVQAEAAGEGGGNG